MTHDYRATAFADNLGDGGQFGPVSTKKSVAVRVGLIGVKPVLAAFGQVVVLK